MPLLVVIPVKDSALQRDNDGADSAASERTRAKILEDASEGLELRRVAERGFSLRVALVGLHEFESRSKAAAASGEGLAFAGKLEKASSEDVAAKLAVLAGEACLLPVFAQCRGGGGEKLAEVYALFWCRRGLKVCSAPSFVAVVVFVDINSVTTEDRDK